MPRVQADRLTEIASRLLQAAGASPDEASTVARHCIGANLAGHDSHGIIAVPTYIDRMKVGHIVAGAPVEIVHRNPIRRRRRPSWTATGGSDSSSPST